jgi:hypothetical protein
MVIGNLCPMNEARRGYRASPVDYAGAFAQWSVDLLKSILCLSRVEYIALPARGRRGGGGGGDADDTGSAEGSSSGAIEVAVTEGSTVMLSLSNYPEGCGAVTVLSAAGAGADEAGAAPAFAAKAGARGRNSHNGITVSVIDESRPSGPASSADSRKGKGRGAVSAPAPVPVVGVTAPSEAELLVGVSGAAQTGAGGGSCKVIKVVGKCVGEAVLKVSYRQDHRLSSELAEVVTYFVKMRVVPRIPVHSSAAHELIGLLEAVPARIVQGNAGVAQPASYEQARFVFRCQCMSGGFSYEKQDQVCILFLLQPIMVV